MSARCFTAFRVTAALAVTMPDSDVGDAIRRPGTNTVLRAQGAIGPLIQGRRTTVDLGLNYTLHKDY